MSQPFKHSAESLHGFFSQVGRGFYIPHYQRNYSWDEENASKLVMDVFSGIRRTITKPNNSIFLGTVILHDEKNVTTGIHLDTPNLVTKVSNIVDGQQRITSIAILACVFSDKITKIAADLRASAGCVVEFENLANELMDELPNLQEFFSIEIKKNGAQPPLKPLVIRAGDTTSNLVSDQWTLAGDIKYFYKSNTSSFLSEFIAGISIGSISKDNRVGSVVDVFKNTIIEEIENADAALAQGLYTANNAPDGSLEKFMAYPPDFSNIQLLTTGEQSLFYGGMLLLAACKFLQNSCHLVVIECLDMGLALDMFQSLNATGTPLTAFEVFKPQIVQAWGNSYSTAIKPQVDRIEYVFETVSDSNSKEDLTGKVLSSSALTYNGVDSINRFSQERDWLSDGLYSTMTPHGAAKIVTRKSEEFITFIADQADYCLKFIKPKKSAKDTNNFGLVKHLQDVGLTPTQADKAALCVFYLRDAGHQLAHSVLSVFYSKLLRVQGNTAAQPAAAADFLTACEATAAFFTLYMGAQKVRFPDSDYKALFQSPTGNISLANGAANQNTQFLKAAFRKALAHQKIYDAADPVTARTLWVDQAKKMPWYSRKAVCKFALFVAFHDAAPDLKLGNEGLFVDGMPNSADFLNCRAWHSKNYEVIEHVATREQPSQIKFKAHFDVTIYPGNESVVDKIGNLTLLSVQVNSSTYSEWPDKVFYYWNLTTPRATATGSTGVALATALGIGNVPPALSTLVASSNYLSHLAPLAYRGQQGGKWDAAFIETRSEHLCTRVFNKLDGWLR